VKAGGARPFALVEIASAFSLPLTFVIVTIGCVPSSFECFAGRGICLYFCASPWHLFAEVFAYGALFGLVPAILAALVIRRTPVPPTFRRVVGIEVLCLSAALPAMAVVGLSVALLGLLAWPVAAGILIAANLPLRRKGVGALAMR